ncbi:TPA: EpsG family protein [Vibrio mimicus]|uniref:EpsG family protein n=1 Tax=Vibrio mimicus TaxID=674 RepID=UPI002F95A866
MIYLVFNSLALVFAFILNKWNLNKNSVQFLMLFVFMSILILPAFQYNVGSDYESYLNIFYSDSLIQGYLEGYDVGFYAVIYVLKFFELNHNVFFFAVSFIHSFLISYLILILKRNGFNVFILLFCILFITNLIHTQMNLIRSSIATYCFLIAVIHTMERKILLAFFFVFLGGIFHKSIFFLVPIFFIIRSNIFVNLTNKALWVYMATFFFYAIFNPNAILSHLASYGFFPQYFQYITSEENLVEKIGLLSLLTKMYYIPLSFAFLFVFSKYKYDYDLFDNKLISMWLLVSNFYLLMSSVDILSRINYYFVFFYVVPAYYLLCSSRVGFNYKLILSLYIIIPYLLKVIFFPVAEFNYETYLF